MQTNIKFKLTSDVASQFSGAKLYIAYSVGTNDEQTPNKLAKIVACGEISTATSSATTSGSSSSSNTSYAQGKTQLFPTNLRIEYNNQSSNGQKFYEVRFDYAVYDTTKYIYPSDVMLNCTGQAAVLMPVFYEDYSRATVFTNWKGYYLPAGANYSTVNCALTWTGGSLATSKVIP